MPLTLASLLLALPLAAPVADQAPTLAPGARVRVTLGETPTRPLVGILESRSDRSLTLRLDQRTRDIPADAIRRVEVSRGRRPSTKWAVLGGLAGGAVGAFAGGCLANKDDYGVLCAGQDDTRYVIGGVVGGLVGGGIGVWLGRTERWEEVDLERQRSARRKALDRCPAARPLDPRGPMPVLDCHEWGRHGFDGNSDPERSKPSVPTGSEIRWEKHNCQRQLGTGCLTKP